MTATRVTRFAIYRDRRPFDPEFLGDVLAHDAAHARDMGRAAFPGGPIVVLRLGIGVHGSPELLRVTAERLARVLPHTVPRRRRRR